MKKKTNTIEAVLVVVTALLIFYAFTHYIWFFRFSLIIAIIALFSKAFAGWIAYGLSLLTKLLGFINSRVLLSLVFFLILVPLAFFQRISKKIFWISNGKKNLCTKKEIKFFKQRT